MDEGVNYMSDHIPLAKWILEFLGIPNYNNSGSKNQEIAKNSQKFQVYS